MNITKMTESSIKVTVDSSAEVMVFVTRSSIGQDTSTIIVKVDSVKQKNTFVNIAETVEVAMQYMLGELPFLDREGEHEVP